MTVDSKTREIKTGHKDPLELDVKKIQLEKISTDPNFKREIVWKNVIGFAILHLGAIYGFYLSITTSKVLTNIWAFIILMLSSQGVLMGAHRLYSHRAYKASWQLRLILVALQTLAGQNCMYIWVRDHRQHHKYSDTDADPHNANRGFFFSHIGWLMSRKHPKVIEKGKAIDMSDLEADRFVMIQKKYYKPLYTLLAVTIPTVVPYYLWNEDFWVSFFVCYLFRYIFQLHGTWLVNSAAHIYGNRPYDEDLKPVENYTVAKITMGEGWHNYHHAFPWDYRAAELGYRDASLTTQLIDLMAHIGWAYDLRTTSDDMVKRRTLRKGDGSHTEISHDIISDLNDAKNLSNKTKLLRDADTNQQNEKNQDGLTGKMNTKDEDIVNDVPKINKYDISIKRKILNRG